MIIYKCKMCGANLSVEPGQKLTKCAYCDTTQTFPSCDDEKKAMLYNRANYFRQGGEFDKAQMIYERILEEDTSDPEVYWSIVLCKYGIEYVQDPKTGSHIPTMNRTMQMSILKDNDYLAAIERADEQTKQYYINEATKIDQIQQTILKIADEANNYDVFISYKEKDPNGERTKASVMAQDLYERLEAENIRTFFSRISLEDKIGNEYEPYIYSALNSAMVMLVIGTKKEEFEATWVKNEWSRYLAMTKENMNKKLIPCFCDMDSYDLPDEFQLIQAQDMSKVGFEQDLLRGIKKILASRNNRSEAVPVQVQTEKQEEINTEDLIENAETYLKIKNYEKAARAYAEWSEKNPGDPNVWWGRIRALTKDFSDPSVLRSKYHDFCDWLGYYKRLVPEDEYMKMSDTIVPFLQRGADAFVDPELNTVQKIIEDNRNSIRDLDCKMQNISYKDQILEQNMKHLSKDVQDGINARKAEREGLKTKRVVKTIQQWVCGGFSVAYLVLLPTFYHPENLLEFYIAIGLSITFGFFSIKGTIAKMKMKKRSLELDKEIENIQMSILQGDPNLTEEDYKKDLQSKIDHHNETIAYAQKYLQSPTSEIKNLICGMMCNEIGFRQSVNEELGALRQRVFQKN